MTEVSDLQTLSARTANVLMRNGIHSVDDIKANYPKGLLRLTGFGMRALREVEAEFFPEFKYDQRSAKAKHLPNDELTEYLRSKASKPPKINRQA